MLEKMDKFFEARLDGYDAHMMTNIDSAEEFYPFTADCLPKEPGCCVLDLGCGTGRAGFFLSYRTGAQTVGIEYDPRIYGDALENRRTTLSRVKPDFVLTRAEEYAVPPNVNRCYFFNPFSVEILHKVLARIMESYYDHPGRCISFSITPPMNMSPA